MLCARWIVIALAVGCCGGSGTSLVQAEEYRDAALHFSLTLPNGWERMDEAQLKDLNTDESDPGKPGEFIAGFTPVETSQFPGAQVLLSVEKLPMQGLTYDDVVAQLKRTLANRLTFVVEDENAPPKTPSVGEARLDRKRNRVVLRTPPEVSEFGKLHNYTVVALGSKGMVAVRCYDLNDEFPKAFDDFRAIADSFHFDAGFEFKPASAPTRWTPSAGLIGLVVFLVVLAGGVIFAWLKKKPKPRTPEKLEWPGPLT